MPERVQAKEGLDAILSPRSVAVIGASARPGSVGHALVRSILDGGFSGPVYAVNPAGGTIEGLPVHRSVTTIPGVVDLAVVAVPAAAVLAVAEECGRKGVRGLLVVTAGFRESDGAGAARESQLRDVLAKFHMRMVGPNCLGIVNASPSVRLFATFAPRPVKAGGTAIVTQSGAIGIALLEQAAHVGLGVARFVSMGNKTDVSGNDLLLLWEDDPDVRQVLMYLENFGNPRNFVRIARRLTRRKPIVVVKSGRTAKGARAAGSHTGALVQSDALVDALLHQCGVLRADGVEDLFDVATALATGRTMAGPRVAVVTNSGGPAILAADALEKAGLELAEFVPATLGRLAAIIPAESHPSNPLDLLAGGSPAGFEAALRAVVDDPGVDAVIAIWTPLEEAQTGQAEAIARALSAAAKPAAAVLFGHGPATPAFKVLAAAGVPTSSFPENAVRSLAAMRQASAWQASPHPEPMRRDVDDAEARTVLATSKPGPDGWLSMADALRLAAAYGIRVPAWRAATDAGSAVRAAAEVGFPVALKLDAPGLVHKTEAGAVLLGLAAPQDVEVGFARAVARLRELGLDPRSCIVMAMAPPAPELLVGATQDPLFGPVVACGAGGIYTEILKDVQVRLAPLADAEAADLVAGLRMAPILAGARGAGPADVAALQDLLVRIGQLAADHPEVAEVECNPIRVLPRGQGALAVDVRVRLRVVPGATGK